VSVNAPRSYRFPVQINLCVTSEIVAIVEFNSVRLSVESYGVGLGVAMGDVIVGVATGDERVGVTVGVTVGVGGLHPTRNTVSSTASNFFIRTPRRMNIHKNHSAYNHPL